MVTKQKCVTEDFCLETDCGSASKHAIEPFHNHQDIYKVFTNNKKGLLNIFPYKNE